MTRLIHVFSMGKFDELEIPHETHNKKRLAHGRVLAACSAKQGRTFQEMELFARGGNFAESLERSKKWGNDHKPNPAAYSTRL